MKAEIHSYRGRLKTLTKSIIENAYGLEPPPPPPEKNLDDKELASFSRDFIKAMVKTLLKDDKFVCKTDEEV